AGTGRMIWSERLDSNRQGTLENIRRFGIFPLLPIELAQVVEAGCVLGIIPTQRFRRDAHCALQQWLRILSSVLYVVDDGEICQHWKHFLAVSPVGPGLEPKNALVRCFSLGILAFLFIDGRQVIKGDDHWFLIGCGMLLQYGKRSLEKRFCLLKPTFFTICSGQVGEAAS